MCYPPLIAFLPLWWLSQWQLGAFTTSAARLAAMTVPRALPTLRTPLLSLHALTSPDEPAAVIWTFELIDTAGQCMRLHDACRGAR